jgi:hypothetical protein
MHTMDRRKLMVGGAIGAAGVTLAAMPALAAFAEDAQTRELWQRYIRLELRISDFCNAEDEASSRAYRDYETLARPWRPIGKRRWETKAEQSEQRLFLEQTLVPTVANREGVWHVEEFQSKPFHLPCLQDYRRDDDAVRWQPYPAAQSEEEALELSKSRADSEATTDLGESPRRPTRIA